MVKETLQQRADKIGVSRQRQWQIDQIAKGNCEICGNKRNKHARRCEPCFEKQRKYNQSRYANGHHDKQKLSGAAYGKQDDAAGYCGD